jgi:uncharacterized integral membrane protein (TIGR00698 family)
VVASLASEGFVPRAPERRVPTRFAAGLSVIALVVAAGFACNRAVPSASPLLWAMGFGVLLAPFAHARPSTADGIRLSATHLLRIGVALLGLRISVGQLADVGLGGVAVAVGTIASTMTLTTWLGRRLGVPRKLGLLIATGTAVCGASAIAAMDSAIGAREEDVGYAIATVTVFGTAAMLLLAPVSALLGLSPSRAGIWAGASIHEVAQATAAGAVVSVGALKIATLVKLCRVVMLAPLVAIVGARRPGKAAARPSVPGFVLAFLALVVVRSFVAVPDAVLHASTVASTTLLAAGLAALGLGIRTQALRAAGMRPLVLGVAAWAIAATTALGLLVLLA